MTGPHFNDSNVMFCRQSEQGLGNAHVIVEVALRIEHIILLLKHRCHQLLRRCLTVSAGNADNRNLKLPAMLPGQVLERLEAVVHLNDAPPLILRGGRLLPSGRLGGGHTLVNNSIATSLFQRCSCKQVTIKLLTFQCQENASLWAVAAVSCDAGVLLIEPIKFLNSHASSDFCCKVTKRMAKQRKKARLLPSLAFFCVIIITLCSRKCVFNI